MVSARKLLASTAAVLAAAAAPAATAGAQVVQYYTTGMFTCAPCIGSGTGSVIFGAGPSALTLTFLAPLGTNGTTGANAANPAEVDLTLDNPSFASFGAFDVSGGQVGVSTPINGSFTLNIFQIAPSGGTNMLVGTLSGSLTGASSGAAFNAPLVTVGINGVGYRYANTRYALVPQTTNGGVTTLQGEIVAPFGPTQLVPEPSTYALLGSGIVALGFVARRRRA